MTDSPTKFWIVVDDDGNIVGERHATEYHAKKFAEQTARNNGGEFFHVAEVVGSVVADNIRWVTPEPELPF